MIVVNQSLIHRIGSSVSYNSLGPEERESGKKKKQTKREESIR